MVFALDLYLTFLDAFLVDLFNGLVSVLVAGSFISNMWTLKRKGIFEYESALGYLLWTDRPLVVPVV